MYDKTTKNIKKDWQKAEKQHIFKAYKVSKLHFHIAFQYEKVEKYFLVCFF